MFIKCICIYSLGASDELATILNKRLSAGGLASSLSTSLHVPGGFGSTGLSSNSQILSCPNSPTFPR